MRGQKFREIIRDRRRETDRTEKLLELLRAERAPEPSPEYLAAFWPRLREKLSPRRPAILHPLHYGGLAAAAAALVLWVTLSGPDGAEQVRPDLPVYTLATASSPGGGERPETSYVSGPSRTAGRRQSGGINYVLPRIAERETGRLEV
jgi:hypothetical protein